MLTHSYDHSFRLAKASFLAELGLVLRSEIAIAPMAKATKRYLKDSSFELVSFHGLFRAVVQHLYRYALYHDIVP
jgi:hypothetical protein